MKTYKNGVSNSYPNDRVGKVYFAQTNIAGIELVKIGFYNGSYNILSNLKSRYRSSFELLKTIDGTGETEQQIHIRFAKVNTRIVYQQSGRQHICTEFFRLTSEVLLFIALI